VAEARTRSIRITNLPPATQEGLLQQMLEKIVPVSRVEVFIDKQEAIVELKTPAVSPAVPTLLWYDTDAFLKQDAGRLLLRTEPIIFGGNALKLGEDITSSRSSQVPNQTRGTTLFAPRKLGPSKPRAGLGFKKDRPDEPHVTAAGSSSAGSGSKGQDDFRKMLGRK
jgi:squamous cell carcinoma antigen recognized by T-cells 3